MQSGAIWTLKLSRHQDFVVVKKERYTWWPFPAYIYIFSVCFSYHSIHGLRKFLIDIEFSKAILPVIWCWNKLTSNVCHVQLVSHDHFLENVENHAVIQSIFFRHSCSKIPVLRLLRAEAERSLTAFVAGTARSIKVIPLFCIAHNIATSKMAAVLPTTAKRTNIVNVYCIADCSICKEEEIEEIY